MSSGGDFVESIGVAVAAQSRWIFLSVALHKHCLRSYFHFCWPDSSRPRIQVNAETLWQVMSAGSEVVDDTDGGEDNRFSLSDLMLNLAQVQTTSPVHSLTD